MTVNDPLQRLLDEQAITRHLFQYARGVDRMDRALARACWHPDGSADYRNMFEGSADELLDWMWKLHSTMSTHSHQVTNRLIEVLGDRATSEAYFTATLRTAGDPVTDIITRGRYLDRWSKRNDSWAIDHRLCLADHSVMTPVGEIPVAAAGARDGSDPSYALVEAAVPGG